MNAVLAASFRMNLRHWSNGKLAALNLAVEFGAVPAQNIAFKDAVALGLIAIEARSMKVDEADGGNLTIEREAGYPTESEELKAAITAEVNSRVDAGTFS